MAKKIRWSPKAASNFEETCDYIAKDSEVYSTLFAEKINMAIKSIPQFPKAVSKARLLKLLRLTIVQNHWRMLYKGGKTKKQEEIKCMKHILRRVRLTTMKGKLRTIN
ncbi:MAG: hypothetical protein J5U19_03845 [Candidatus Methanoperedens sp.]|nr:hypothetical protein [Candidatus Methanoperedens sp.]